uniref:(California timema) hypothetical protein n=2 Tax=Timema TaxID=61471 RepID=A0A7R9IWN9_TIMCA|nr:unnamed protein product [Timema californicum]
MLRSRAKKVTLKTVKQLDAFPKVPDSYVETSPVGGTFSVVTCFLILWLMYAEISYYLDSRFIFKFLPDTDFDAKLKINVDLTVAMPCGSIGADILDSTDQNVLQFGRLEQEDTWFELCPEQKLHFDGVRHVNSYLREEFHAIQELLWKTGQNTLFGELPKRSVIPNRDPDACRVFGSLTLNKVAGNFHITAGRSLALPRGHIHISAFVSEREYNFSHRIDRFSFGDPSPGIVHPLEGDEKITAENMMLYQYFVEVVPTEVNTFLQTLTTYQYSVKDHQRPINHHKGSHGVPGIFFKYDMSALKVRVTQQRDSLGQFLVHLSATVSGIYITSGIINSLVQILVNVFTCKYLNSKERRVAYSKKPRPAISLVKPDIIPDIAVMSSLPDISPT